jgi:hypothetical protein
VCVGALVHILCWPSPLIHICPAERLTTESAAAQVSIDEGDGNIFRLTGPKTVYQVMDAILRTGRGDAMDYQYTASDRETPTDCSRCPRQVRACMYHTTRHEMATAFARLSLGQDATS